MSYKVMRGICRSNTLRNAVLALRREPLALAHPESTLIHGCNLAETGATLQRDGLALGLRVDESVCQAVRSYCAQRPATTDKGEQVMVTDAEKAPLADRFLYRYPEMHKRVPAVTALANDPLLLAVVSNYLGRKPLLLGSRAWYSYPVPRSDGNSQQPCEYGFHYDIDDYKFIKLFTYLTDVDETCGPHVAIVNTHRVKSMFEKMNRRISDEVAARRYGERIVVITGKAGAAFFEDTFCYHKGTAPQKRRFLLEIEYGVTRFPHR